MKTIKKYWAVIIGGILTLFAIIIAIFNKHEKKQVSKIEEKIDDNKSKIDQLQGKTDVIETQRTQVKEELDDLDLELELDLDLEELDDLDLELELEEELDDFAPPRNDSPCSSNAIENE